MAGRNDGKSSNVLKSGEKSRFEPKRKGQEAQI